MGTVASFADQMPVFLDDTPGGPFARFTKRLQHAMRGTPQQLNNIEISPFGLHWPDLDEDLSFRGLLKGDFGQSQKKV